MGPAGFRLGRLDRRGQGVVRLFPAAVVLLDEGLQAGRIEIPGHEQDGVVRGVEPLLVELAVFKLIGHVLNVLQEAQRRVFIGMGGEGRVAEKLDQAAARVGGAGIVFALDDRGLGPDHVLV